MTEAEFRKKAEAIKERYSKFVFYFDKRRKKNFVLFLSFSHLAWRSQLVY